MDETSYRVIMLMAMSKKTLMKFKSGTMSSRKEVLKKLKGMIRVGFCFVVCVYFASLFDNVLV